MKRTFKKTIAALFAATTMAVGMSSLGVSAASWEASHVNVPGAPSSESTTAYVTVNHRAAGAKAVCNTNTHTNSSATTGTTTIHCVTYSMTDQKITKTGSATCKPDVGSPTVDVAVQYRISAYTPTSNDVFWSKGNITKIS